MKNIKALTAKVIEFAKKKKDFNKLDKENFIDFLKIFYLQNQIEDFQNSTIESLYNFALSAFNNLLIRKNKEIKVKSFNPSIKKDGFETTYSLVEIISQDMPFLVDSTVAYLDKQGIKVKNITHPIYSVVRDGENKIKSISHPENGNQESVIQLYLEKITSKKNLNDLTDNIKKILNSVSLVVGDWDSMVKLANKASDDLSNSEKLITKSEVNEIKDFISWMVGGNFILLGAKEFKITKGGKNQYLLNEEEGKSFGVFRSKYDDFRPEVKNSSPKEVCDSVTNPYVVEVLKSRYRSKIHRSTNAERIRIQKISSKGEVIGEYRFIGLFTSNAYYKNTNTIPLVRKKIDKVIKDSGYLAGSHIYKELLSILESYPRDELFQIDADDLLKNATGIANISGRSQVKFFARRDKFDRFVSCLIYMPKNRSNSGIRSKIKNYLAEVYGGEIADSFIQINDSNLVRLQTIVRTTQGFKPKVSEIVIEEEITKITKVWSDELRYAIKAKYDEEEQIPLFAKFKNAFSVSYMNRFDPKRAAIDIGRITSALKNNKPVFNLYKSSELLPESISELKIYSPHKEIILSQIMPVLESFGFNVIKEHTYVVSIDEEEKNNRLSKKVWVHYFTLNLSKQGHSFSEKVRLNFEKTISLVWDGVVQVGLLNKLIVAANFHWKHVYIIRAYTKYLHQAVFNYNQPRVTDALVKYHNISTLLIKLFNSKFNPHIKVNKEQRDKKVSNVCKKIEKALGEVSDIAEDKIIRRLFQAIKATLRTNYYQSVDGKDTHFKGYISLKINCSAIPQLPLPLPYAEIFVYSTRVEAVHLRGGKVARGGLRWSDRHDDFRTEVLGLMKAQMTKNAVIVPEGSKGGFVVKKDLTGLSREETQKEGIECYKTFLRGALDVTDNYINNKIVHPENVVRYDGPDPYFVVAADKGTATFSDIANSISEEYNFWLGDAFASGGSVGYDHKKMGITAKGAWVSVKRHFKENGIDTQSQDFTCAGIGDLAGDVFGNGMLLSKHIKLVAAFNHMHIFLDPKPNSAKSYVERKRVFNLKRSTWMDYNQSLISKGGGIFSRSEKSISISPEMKEVLGIEEDQLTPTDLIRAILKSPVDLLWNGGIGTYVKGELESNLEVGDRANDALRINGSELRCSVIGEGGNLGFTQRGRIEYALNAGRVNTDAMDNSAGVDCSDHEVNIKIALTSAMRNKKITLKERNKILESMTQEVSDLVLRDNELQTQAISIASFQGHGSLGDQAQFMLKLEDSGLLNRKIEFLPSKKEIEKRQLDKISLTRPELCVLLSYAKMEIYNQIVSSDLVKDKYFEKDLFEYFPKAMQKKFSSEILNHQLRDEIIATQITNFVIDRSGITFINQICQDSGFSVVEVIKCFIIASDSFRIREFLEEVESMGPKVSHHIKMQIFLSATKLIERSIIWLLHNQVKGDLSEIVKRFRKIADNLSGVLSGVLAKASRESFERKVEKYRLNNVESKLATKVAAMDPIASAFDIAQISNESKFDIETIAKIYFAVGTRFSLKWLRSRVAALSQEDYWQKLSSKTVLEDIYSYQMKIAKSIVDNSCKDKTLCEVKSVEKWIKDREFLIDRFDKFISDLKNQANPDLSIFIVALNRVKSLVN